MLLGPFILKITILILACTFAYRSYLAFMNPNGTSTRRVVVGRQPSGFVGPFFLFD